MVSWVKEFYDKEAKVYLSRRPFMKSYVFQRILNLLSIFLKDNAVTLDISCGPGYLEKQISAGSKAFYVALDISREMVRITKNSAPQVEVLVADAETLPFRQSSFNLVICSRFVKFLKDPTEFFRRLTDILEKRGFLVIIVDTGDALWIRLLERLGKPVDYVGARGSMLKTRDLEQFLRSSSFEIVRVAPITFMPLSIFRYIPTYFCKFIEHFDRPAKRARITFIASRTKELSIAHNLSNTPIDDRKRYNTNNEENR